MMDPHASAQDADVEAGRETRQEDPLSDANLLSQVISGKLRGQSEDALAQIYDRHALAVYRLALRIAGNERLAEAVTEDVFVRVWQNAETLHSSCVGSETRLPTWLLRLTQSLAITALRTSAQRSRTDRVGDLAGQNAADSAEPRSYTAGGAVTAQRAIDLALFAGLTCAEIAALTNSTPERVQRALRVGLQPQRST